MFERLRRYRSRITLSLSALLVVLSFLGIAEWLARCYAPSAHPLTLGPDYILFLRENMQPLFHVRSIHGQTYLVRNDVVWEPPANERFPFDKPSGVRRIIIVGESSADDLGNALETQVADGAGAKRYEVLNCAISGADLNIVERRAKECLRYSPDAVIFLFGHNLYYFHPIMSPFLLKLALWMRSSALFYDLDALEKPRRYEYAERLRALETFIDKLARETKSRNIPLILATVPSNLWVEPQTSTLDESDPTYLNTLYNYAIGRRQQAISLLTQALNTHACALWHFTLGTWLYRKGAWQKAYAQLILARDLDPARMRASTAVNDTIRRAAIRDGVSLIDAERIISEQSPHGIPGWAQFMDAQHATENNFSRLASLCAAQLMKNGWGSPISEGRITKSRSSHPIKYEYVASAFYGLPRPAPDGWRTFSYFAQSHLSQMTTNVGPLFIRAFPNPRERASAFLGLAQALWRAGRRAEARADNAKAKRLADDWDAPNMQSGFFDLQEHRRQEALGDFRRALKKRPKDARALFFIYKLETHRNG